MDEQQARLTAEIRGRVAGLGYELVDLRQRGTRQRVVLKVRIDRPDATPGHGITVEECATVSRALERWLDETDALGPRYALEVSSPGIERPVRWPEHWERYTGHDVHVRVAGRGRLRATIMGLVPDRTAVVLRPAGAEETLSVPFEEARDATLVVDWSDIESARSKERP